MYTSNVFNIVLLILAIWTIPWKGYALWLAVKRNETRWFIVILILNTVGLLEIFYIFRIVNKSWVEVKEDFHKALESLKKNNKDDTFTAE